MEQSDKGKIPRQKVCSDKLKKTSERCLLQVMQKYGRTSILKAYQYIEGVGEKETDSDRGACVERNGKKNITVADERILPEYP